MLTRSACCQRRKVRLPSLCPLPRLQHLHQPQLISLHLNLFLRLVHQFRLWCRLRRFAKAPPSPPAQNMAASEGDKPGTLICLEWGEFSGSDLTRATAALSALQLANKLGQRQIERDIGYWVYIPPLKNKAAVNRKITELKAAGLREYFVVQTPGHWLNAISLGVFKTRDAAENFLHVVHAKGVRTAKVGERASKLRTTVFMLNKVDAGTEIKLKAMQKDFAGSELNHVPCGLTR